MGFFDRFATTSSLFGKSTHETQRRVGCFILLPGALLAVIRQQLLPIVEAESGGLSEQVSSQIALEAALAITASCEVEFTPPVRRWWGTRGDALREFVAMILLSESGDPRSVLEKAGYSSNPGEARAQLVGRISELLGKQDATLIRALQQQKFLEPWKILVSSFVAGTLLGVSRNEESALGRTRRDLLDLSPRGQALVQEFMKKSNAGKFLL